ncbi:MAG: hypothetical protein ACUVR4_14195 [Anaerolineae bacterium]
MIRCNWCAVVGSLLAVLFLAACGSAMAGSLTYSGPIEQTVAIGETIPGSNIRYVGYGDDGAEVLINDQRALKKVGDSLD